MNLTEDEIIQKYRKHWGHCNRDIMLPYEYEITCFSCRYKLITRKPELSQIHRKK